jgi:hypothetical protein
MRFLKKRIISEKEMKFEAPIWLMFCLWLLMKGDFEEFAVTFL